MFDAYVIELKHLIVDLDLARIHELWHVSSINKKSQHFVVLYDNTMHLCTCLTLINRVLICHHFFATMLVSLATKFHIRLIPQRWYTNISIMEADLILSNEPAILVVSDDKFDTVEHIVEIDLSFLESIRRCHVFTKEICQEITRKQQWGKGFGIMKKTLNLAITMGRLDELYEFHEKFVKEMEAEITAQTLQGNDIFEFACTINNPHSIRSKG